MQSRPELPPRRLSVDRKSPDFDPERHKADDVEVYFNDIRQIKCVHGYDVDTGVLVRYRKTGLGKFVTDRFHQPLLETKTGVIRVEWKEEANER